MLDAFYHGLTLVLQWPAFGFLLLGVVAGIWLGAVPGLGGIIGMVVLLPFTFDMEPVAAFALLLALYAVTATSDTISSVMLGIPGTVASQATILDGHPMAKKGQASRALGAAFTVSAFGGVFGALLLAISMPIIQPIILAFGSPEIFMLGVLGLVMVGLLAGRSLYKGIAAALIGLALSCIGYAETMAIPRYWFGTTYLLDGLPLVPTVLGLFAIPELIELATRNVSISRVPEAEAEESGIFRGMRDAVEHWWLALRCASIGVYIGMLPGLGGAIVDWIAYGHAVQSAKDKSQFGQGDIRGVIAPESANNATRGGELIPTVAFGIPGSLGSAILLGALLIQGLRPGPDMLGEQLPVTFSMVWTIIIANLIAASVLMVWARQVAKVAFIDGHLIVPGVIVFIFMGAWLGGASIGDWITCLTMGCVGYVMKRAGWARPPLVLAFILGNILETAFQISNRAYDGYGWFGRPIVLILLAFVIVTVFFIARGKIRDRGKTPLVEGGEGTDVNPLMSLPLAAVAIALFAWIGFGALDWPTEVSQFPILIAIPGVILGVLVLGRDTAEWREMAAQLGGAAGVAADCARRALLARSGMFFLYLLATLAITLIAGQAIALVIFVAVYLWRWGHFGWKTVVAYAAAAALFLWGFYGETLHIAWHPAPLFDWLDI